MARSSYVTRIKGRIAELEKLIVDASNELKELKIAERVLDRLAADGTDEQVDSGDIDRAKEPKITELIQSALAKYGPSDTMSLVEAVNELRSSPASPATIQSTLSRAKAAKLVDNADGKWRLVAGGVESVSIETKEAPGGASDGWE